MRELNKLEINLNNNQIWDDEENIEDQELEMNKLEFLSIRASENKLTKLNNMIFMTISTSLKILLLDLANNNISSLVEINNLIKA